MPLISPDRLDVIQIITGVLKAGNESCDQTDLKQIQVLHCPALINLKLFHTVNQKYFTSDDRKMVISFKVIN